MNLSPYPPRGPRATHPSVRTDLEKVRICQAFLEKRGYIVMNQLMSNKELSELLGVSVATVLALSKSPGFPVPYDIGSKKVNVDSHKKFYRWKSQDIRDWLDSRQMDDVCAKS